MDTCYLEKRHFELKSRKHKVLDELWELTQNYRDKYLGEITKSSEELDILMAVENTDEFKNLLEELNCVKNSLNELYIKFLDDNLDTDLKKDKIIALKGMWGEEITTSEITRAVNCSKGYARQFYLLNGKVVQKESRNGIRAKTKREVLKRDQNACIVCGSPEGLEVHHIIPVMGSTIKDQDEAHNLALLCKECHYLAHSSNIMYRYMTKLIRDNINHKPLDDYIKDTKNLKTTKKLPNSAK